MSIEEYASRQLAGDIERLRRWAGGELTVMACCTCRCVAVVIPRDGCSVGYTQAPSMSLEQLEKLVTENKPDWAVAVQADKQPIGCYQVFS